MYYLALPASCEYANFKDYLKYIGINSGISVTLHKVRVEFYIESGLVAIGVGISKIFNVCVKPDTTDRYSHNVKVL